MGLAIPIGCLQCEYDLPGPVECKPSIDDGGAGDVAAQALRPRRAKQATSLCLAFEFLPLRGAAHLGMEAKALLAGTAPGVGGASCVGTGWSPPSGPVAQPLPAVGRRLVQRRNTPLPGRMPFGRDRLLARIHQPADSRPFCDFSQKRTS